MQPLNQPTVNYHELCELCGKDAYFLCGECKFGAYCSRDHQKEHWKAHKEHCEIMNSYRLRNEEGEVSRERSELRKKYLQYFMHKGYDMCIKTAEQIVQLEKKHIKTTREYFNELQYGISVCLLARSWLNINNDTKANVILTAYLNEKQHFLEDLGDIAYLGVKKSEKGRNIGKEPNSDTGFDFLNIDDSLTEASDIVKEFALNKVSLLACVANILHHLREPNNHIYEVYIKHIEKMFGKESQEVSNCYFMMGSYFMERKQFNKSIACYLRAAELRGSKGGDCFFNLGIIFYICNKHPMSLRMFDNAVKLRINEFGDSSTEVAEVYHSISLVHQSRKNYQEAINNAEKILLISSKDKNSPEYQNAKNSIKELKENLKASLEGFASEADSNRGKFLDLKKNLKDFRKSSKAKADDSAQDNYVDHIDIRSLLQIPDHLLNKMNPLELFHLSELQLELEQCETEFMAAKAVGSSKFLKVIKAANLLELQKTNQSLFKHIHTEKLSKREEYKPAQ